MLIVFLIFYQYEQIPLMCTVYSYSSTFNLILYNKSSTVRWISTNVTPPSDFTSKEPPCNPKIAPRPEDDSAWVALCNDPQWRYKERRL